MHGTFQQPHPLGSIASISSAQVTGADEALRDLRAAYPDIDAAWDASALPDLQKPEDEPKGLAELRSLFDSLDRDGNGKITQQEWGKKVNEFDYVMGKYFGGVSLKEVGQQFKRIDADGSAELSWEEFVIAAGLEELLIAEKSPPPDRLAELRSLFDSLDKDGDGNVSGKAWVQKIEENQVLLSKYFGGTTLDEIGMALVRMDVDGNASLSWDEFVAAAGLGIPQGLAELRSLLCFF